MALLDWINEATGPVVKGRGVTLRAPRASDYEAWSASEKMKNGQALPASISRP